MSKNIKDDKILVRLATQYHGNFDITMTLGSTGRDIKVSLSGKLRELGKLPAKELRLLYQGREFKNDSCICDLNLSHGGTLELFAVGQTEKSRAYQKVNNFRILKRNVDECIGCAKNGTNPRERTRYNDPPCDTPPQPNAKYLAELLKEMGTSFCAMSDNLNDLASTLRENEIYDNTELYEEKRRLVQNNMDAVRYSNPMLINLTKLRIPVNQPQAVVQLAESSIVPIRRPSTRRTGCPTV